ncbi:MULTISPECIES: helix-turn-helix domain-containing protein [unclassified Clostridioides]|uniref:helix-turn-helix domain-containing protein n=1 Tax=unclassified Clostridioides TaxID=2635829 RepID=UPI001D0CA0FA|nr:helix-turn-helix domain-containing protein [Clostridioides sp. ES-S-0001-02]MCC0639709.1 helix-turn-helix domain-containing protein [Clostridioides sp. ES-S-0049-03]MCC0651251.1 helix-turn-helix domain-containing protein [Clostridioides sp. ES-S-0001-03]MCC0673773.1 helix-turn-helix domain-containing protein [Clostridioides sp. ES-S-0145-01]MCC0676364.1 helix-turn-helix domain-containing protein [Clostridioides sp. ES-W-0018-02]MCC0680745.1 helix-turn-helix domain-containing protein [Clostr
MEEKFYTIDQVANILEMHHKTIRKFIKDGKLKANKVGKQWRVSQEDLNSFMDVKSENEDKGIEFRLNASENLASIPKVNVSTVVEINNISNNEYSRLSNLLLALTNNPTSISSGSTINLKYAENENRLRVMLWGDIKFIEEMLSSISLLIENI